MGTLQIEHWWPVSRGGSDDAGNLCLACELCNQAKWAKTEAIDPVTTEASALFNPREQRWEEHFTWNEAGTEIVGLTPCGRATVVSLQLNNALAVTVRGNWVRAGWHPPR